MYTGDCCVVCACVRMIVWDFLCVCLYLLVVVVA